jgi:hypothetical protein
MTLGKRQGRKSDPIVTILFGLFVQPYTTPNGMGSVAAWVFQRGVPHHPLATRQLCRGALQQLLGEFLGAGAAPSRGISAATKRVGFS